MTISLKVIIFLVNESKLNTVGQKKMPKRKKEKKISLYINYMELQLQYVTIKLILIGSFLAFKRSSLIVFFYPISGKFTKVVKITPSIWVALMEGKGQELQDKVRIFKQ